MRTIEFDFTFNDGRTARITCEMAPAEPDVGIMGPYPDCISGKYEDGSDVPDAFIEAQLESLSDKAAQIYYEGDEP